MVNTITLSKRDATYVRQSWVFIMND